MALIFYFKLLKSHDINSRMCHIANLIVLYLRTNQAVSSLSERLSVLVVVLSLGIGTMFMSSFYNNLQN